VNILNGVSILATETVSDQSTAGVSILDFSPITGVTKVINANSVTGTVVGFQNLSTGTQVVANSANPATVTTTLFNMKTGTDAVSVGFDGGVAGSTIAAAFAASSATAATLSSTGAANGFLNGVKTADTTAFTTGTATVKTLTVNATTDLVTNLAAGDFVATGADLTASGAASTVDFNGSVVNSFKTVNAGGLTAGGIVVTTGALLTSFTGGVGNDVLTLGAAPSASATINLGNGNDALQGLLAAAPGITVTIDAGAGTDTTAADLVNAGNAANFKAFEQVDMAGMAAADNLDVTLLTNSTITGVVMSAQAAIGAAATISGLAAATANNVFVSATTAGQTETLTYTGATGAADAINVTFNGANQAVVPVAPNIFAGTVTTKNIEQINFTSGGGTNTWNQYTSTDNNLQKVVVAASSHNLNFTLTAQADVTAGVSTTSAFTSFDGSAATGNLVFTQTIPAATISHAAVAIKGGTGNDTLFAITSATGTNAGSPPSGADTVTTGAGTDIVNVATAPVRSITAPLATTIADFVKGDAITFNAAAATFVTTKVDVSGASTLVEALTTATAGATVGAVDWFQFGGNTYIVEDTNAGTFNVADIAVKLTGLLDLSTSLKGTVDKLNFLMDKWKDEGVNLKLK